MLVFKYRKPRTRGEKVNKKRLALAIIGIAIMTVGAYALLSSYGKVTGTTNVNFAVEVDGLSGAPAQAITDVYTLAGGDTITTNHTLKSNSANPQSVTFNGSVEGNDGISVSYLNDTGAPATTTLLQKDVMQTFKIVVTANKLSNNTNATVTTILEPTP